ncbi:hypothetical protein Sste5346_002656 [Sporothrix stenoceras]|uniref:Major facilitator superfamily (MFS) profile domain-containing protein n=1 Tax=Sporothrix stenoceras TaxID=5173 RepID=A0ABR3ZIB0_9PEZI
MAHLSSYNVYIVLLVAVGAYTYGFAFSVFVTSIGLDGFYDFFDLDPTSAYTASIIGAVNGLFAFGCAFGSILQGWVGDWLGRKKTIFWGSVVTAVCAGITAGSQNIAMMIVFRLLEGIGLGALICQVPLYISEVAPAHKRGMLSGLTACGFAFGYLFCAWVAYACSFAANVTLQWRLPLALASLAPVILAAVVWFVPESPRYLSWVGKNEEALAVLQKLHRDPRDPTDQRVALAEFLQISQQVAYDKQHSAGYWDMLVRVPSWRRRSLIILFLFFASQSSGILGIANYSVLIYQNLGMTGHMPLLMYGIYIICGTIPNICSIFVVDRLGRRTMLLWGFPTAGLCMLATALLQMKYNSTTNHAGNAAALFFIFFYQWFYGFFIDPTQFAYAAEIFPTVIRAKGIGLAFFSYFVGAVTYTEAASTAFREIGWRMYMVWFACSMATPFVIYFFVPETKGRTLEEVAELFGDRVVLHMTADGTDIVEKDKDKTEEVLAGGVEVATVHDEGRL